MYTLLDLFRVESNHSLLFTLALSFQTSLAANPSVVILECLFLLPLAFSFRTIENNRQRLVVGRIIPDSIGEHVPPPLSFRTERSDTIKYKNAAAQ